MSEISTNYALPGVTHTVSELNKIGAVIASNLYFLVIAAVIIFLVHKFAQKFIFPRVASKRHALIIIFALHTLVLVATLLLVLGHLGFDISVVAPIALLIVMVIAVIIFFIVPVLPKLPFMLGDMVEIEGVRGKVESIAPIFTHVQTFDGKTVFIPNATIWTKNIINYYSTPNRRVELKLKVSADHSLAEARGVLTEIMQSDERVLGDPAPEIRIVAVGANALEIVGLCWATNADFLRTRSDLYEKVVNAVQSDAGISLSIDKRWVELSGKVADRLKEA